MTRHRAPCRKGLQRGDQLTGSAVASRILGELLDAGWTRPGQDDGEGAGHATG